MGEKHELWKPGLVFTASLWGLLISDQVRDLMIQRTHHLDIDYVATEVHKQAQSPSTLGSVYLFFDMGPFIETEK